MTIWNYSLFWTKNPNFGSKNPDVIKNMPIIQIFFTFFESLYGVLVVCQKLAVKPYPIKS